VYVHSTLNARGRILPRSQAQNRAVRRASRDRIIEHALQLFGQHGFDGTTIRMIAEAAGISQGLIYRYFPSKEALLRAIFEQSMSDVRASFAAAEAGGGPSEQLERLIRASFEVLKRNELFWRLSYGVRMQATVLELLGDRMHDWLEEVRTTLERYLRAAGSPHPETEALILFALIDGISQHYVLDPKNYPLDQVATRVVDMYL
jgi:AcrR family transcriptional regulator